jgi:GntR family transcriptional regulator, N-acetylglucosamine utilization regulator
LDVEFPRELQQRVERAIVNGELDSDQVWTLGDLADRFRVATGQVQWVVLAALRKGLMAEARDGAYRVLGLPTTEFASVFTHTASSGLKPRSEVRQAVVELATPTVAEKLRVEVNSPVYRYVRTRWVNEEALANQTNYMPFEVCPGLEHDDVTHYSFQKLLEEKYHAVLVDMQEEVVLVPATDRDRAVLDLPQGASVLVVDRIALSTSGWPLVWADIRIRLDRFEYVAALWPQAAHLLKNHRGIENTEKP